MLVKINSPILMEKMDPYSGGGGGTPPHKPSFDADSVLISADMSPKDIRERFNVLVKHYAQEEFGKVSKCIKKLDTVISKLKAAGLDVSLSKLTFEEKSKLFPSRKSYSFADKQSQGDFIAGLQISLNIYDQRFLIMPCDENKFYFMNGIINKEFEPPPKPKATDQKNGSIFDFSEPENISLFVEMVYVTAAHCAAMLSAIDDCDSFQKPRTENTASIEIIKGKTVSPLTAKDLKR